MSNFYPVFKKELRSYFTSFIAYIVISMFLLLSGYFFYTDTVYFDLFLTIQGVDITSGLFRQLFQDLNLVILPIIPLLTMRLFAEEKKLGTSELLFTFPLRDGEILLGKFTACLFVYVLMLSLTFLYPLLLCSVWDLEIAPILSGYLGILLIGCAFISLGIFVSSFTENQIVAAMVTFAILLFLGIIAFNAGKTNAVIERILIHLSFLEHLDAFAKGVINTKSIIYCLNFTFFFLFLTLQSLKSNRWRGLK